MVVIGVMSVFLVIKVTFIFRNSWDGKTDLRIGMIDDKGIRIVNISPERKMIGILKVDGQASVWIPDGLGWYRSDKVRGILIQENKMDLLHKMFFYNFGFSPDIVWTDVDSENWMENGNLIRKLGVSNFLVYRKQSRSMVINESVIEDDLDNEYSLLHDIIPRDFSDMRLVSEEARIGVFNSSQENKLAAFLADRLVWSGLNVTTIENSTDKVEGCLMISREVSKISSSTVSLIRQVFGCQEKSDLSLDEQQIDLYFGQDYVSMLKYSNYVRSF